MYKKRYKEKLNITLDCNIKRSLKVLAEREGISVSALITRIFLNSDEFYSLNYFDLEDDNV